MYAHQLCNHGICTQPNPYGCAVPCDACISEREYWCYTADAICGFPSKNSKKTVRQIMREEEENRICAKCGTLIVGNYATIGSSPKEYHPGCVPSLQELMKDSRPTLPPTSIMTYGHVQRLIESHRELTMALRHIFMQAPNAQLNWEYLTHVLERAANASK